MPRCFWRFASRCCSRYCWSSVTAAWVLGSRRDDLRKGETYGTFYLVCIAKVGRNYWLDVQSSDHLVSGSIAALSALSSQNWANTSGSLSSSFSTSTLTMMINSLLLEMGDPKAFLSCAVFDMFGILTRWIKKVAWGSICMVPICCRASESHTSQWCNTSRLVSRLNWWTDAKQRETFMEGFCWNKVPMDVAAYQCQQFRDMLLQPHHILQDTYLNGRRSWSLVLSGSSNTFHVITDNSVKNSRAKSRNQWPHWADIPQCLEERFAVLIPPAFWIVV